MASAAKQRKVESNGKVVDEDELIKKIDMIQSELDTVNEQASEEILEVEKKINQKRQPLYVERAGLIKTIPNFWLTALKNHPALSPLISPQDAEVLQFLTNLEVEEFDDIKSGFKISLTFNAEANPFFSNKKISKSIHVGESELQTNCDTIDWHTGKDYVSAIAASEEASAAANGAAAAAMSLPKSFMLWFTSSKSESMVELGEVIKDDLWPNPLQYFFANETFDDEDNDEDEEEVGDEEDEEEEEEDEGEDEDLEEEQEDEEEEGEDAE